jgi:hypothetical protein
VKLASADLIALLANSREFVYADVFTFYLVGGSDETYRLRYTSHQQDLQVYPLDGDPILRTFRAKACVIAGLRARASIGVGVDEQSIAMSFAEGETIQGVPAIQAILWGALDGATVRRDRYYFADWGQPTVGGAAKFCGLVSTFTELGRMDANLKVKSGLVLLDQQMPRHLTQPKCLNRVYDTACGLDAAAHAVHTTVAGGATTTSIPLAAPSTDFALGRVFFEDMGLVGYWRAIKSSDGGPDPLFAAAGGPGRRRERHHLPRLRQHPRRRLHAPGQHRPLPRLPLRAPGRDRALMDEAATRAAIVAGARRWIDTPYHEQADVLGAGVDCGMILVRVFVDAGLAPAFDPRPYPSDWMMHRDDERYLDVVRGLAAHEYDPRARPPPAGDVVVWKHGRTFSHGASSPARPGRSRAGPGSSTPIRTPAGSRRST